MRIHGADDPVRDLTRWNRAGLSRFRYVEGGAAEWLEYLRVSHLLLYARALADAPTADPDIWRAGFETGEIEGLPVHPAAAALRSAWPQPAPQTFVENAGDYRAALRAQYDRIPLDQTAQISRAFVRAFHLLTESLDAYANEGFLATATQQPHLRRLLELIAFQPRLPASARVPVALSIAADAARQTIDRGLGAEYMPPDGTPLLTFESLDALVVDPGLNLMRPAGWDQRSDPIGAGVTVFPLADPEALNVSLAGTMGLLLQGAAVQGLALTAASKATGSVTVTRGLPGFSGSWQQASLLLGPDAVLPVRPVGPTWLHFKAPPACYVGQVVMLKTGNSFGAADDLATFAMFGGGVGGGFGGGGVAGFGVASAGGGGLTGSTSLSGVGAVGQEYAGFDAVGAWLGIIYSNTATVLEVRGRDVRIGTAVPPFLQEVYPAVRSIVVDNPPDHPADAFDVLALGPYVTQQGAERVGDLANLASGRVHVGSGLPEDVAPGQPVALKMADGKVAAAVIDAVHNDAEDAFSLTLDLPSGYQDGDVASIAMLFGTKVALQHMIRSEEALFPAAAGGVLEVAMPSSLDALLVPGRTLLVAPDPETATEEDAGAGMALTIATASRSGGTLSLTFDEVLDDLAAFRRGHTVIYGNVPILGHGKSLPEKVLGSGDGTEAQQVMTLPAADIATRPDPGFPGGVAPDLEIRVDGRKLRLVSDPDRADPLQPSFTIRLTDAGEAEAVFLSRLPTAADNVRLTRFRQGAGERGNDVPPFAIVKTAPKNPVVEAVIQPIAPQFGADLEGADTLKAQGGSYFSLLDRALSARDFERLAESTAGVWHAHVDLRREAGSQGQPTIVLTVVPSGGGSVEPIRDDLTAFLTARALPGTVLDIQPYRAAPVKGTALVNLKPGYAQDVTIIDEIRSAVHGAFELKARSLGRTLFVTEIVSVIEAHEAVQNLVFTLLPDWSAADAPRVATSVSGAIQAVMPAPQQTVFVAEPGDIAVTLAGGAP